MGTEDPAVSTPLLGGRNSLEPKASRKSIVDTSSAGAQGFNDGVVIVLVSWGILFFLTWSLRNHNI
jgi:hypothetical protein